MELRLPLCGPAEQPLDAVLRRCNTFHFISFHFISETPIAPAAPAAQNHTQPRGSDTIRTPPSTGQRHGRSKSRSRSPSAAALHNNRFASLRDGTD